MNRNMGLILLIVLVIGCAPITPAAIEKRESRTYEQMNREEQFKRDEKDCLYLNGRMVIERNGKAKRRQEILNVPGRGDGWTCVANNRIH